MPRLRREVRELVSKRKSVETIWRRTEGFPAGFQNYSKEQENLLDDIREGSLLGAEAALEKLKAMWTGSEEQEKPATRALKRLDIHEIEARFQEAFRLSPEDIGDLRVPRRKSHKPLREVLIYLVWKRTGLNLRFIGAHFGVGYSSVSHARKRGEDALSKAPKLRRAAAALL